MQVGMWYAPYFATFQKRLIGRGALFGYHRTHPVGGGNKGRWETGKERERRVSCEGLKPVPPQIWLLLLSCH